MLKQRLFFLILCATLTLNFSPANAQTIEISIPVVEVLDLNVSGNLTNPNIVSAVYDYTIITRVIWDLVFTTNTLDIDNFADDSALTNGVNVLYQDISLLDNSNITTNHDFAHATYDVNILSDEKNPKTRALSSRWSFDKFVGCECGGLLMDNDQTFSIYIQDDITALTTISEYQITIEGYKVLYFAVVGNHYQEVTGHNIDRDYIAEVNDFVTDNQGAIFLFLATFVGVLIVILIYMRRK